MSRRQSVATSTGNEEPQAMMQRRRAPSNNELVGKPKRPRFERFAAAMEHARATDAPELGLYNDEAAANGDGRTPYGEHGDQPTGYDEQPTVYGDQPAAYGDRPTGYDEQAAEYYDQRTAYYDQRAVYEDPPAAYDGQPAAFSSPVPRPALRPVAPRSRRARARAALRWIGIGSCVLVVCLLIAGWLAWPETARLVGRWLAAEQSGETAQAQTLIPAPQPDPKAAADG
jgi:hypothetical protein